MDVRLITATCESMLTTLPRSVKLRPSVAQAIDFLNTLLQTKAVRRCYHICVQLLPNCECMEQQSEHEVAAWNSGSSSSSSTTNSNNTVSADLGLPAGDVRGSTWLQLMFN